MKVRLSVSSQPQIGYLNIDPMPKPDTNNQAQTIVADIKKLDGIVNDAECTELLCYYALDYIPAFLLEEILAHWVRKIRHGGEIIIVAIDAREAAKSLITGEIDIIKYNQLIFGLKETYVHHKHGCYTLNVVASILQNLGLQITSQSLDSIELTIKARRNT